MKYLVVATALFMMTHVVSGQQNWCGTDAHNESLLRNMEPAGAAFAVEQRERLFGLTQAAGGEQSGVIITVPVVVHVLHDNCNGNISMEQILDGIRVINEDFRRINSDTGATRALFKPFAGDAEIEFKLARIDPNGKCTEGVNRINTPATYDAQDNVKGLSYWPSSKYLNVWLVESIEGSSGTILGYAQFPGFGGWSTYGLVVRNDQWGTIGSSNADGRTPTHEIGHCLGLYHTFQSGCGNSCSNSGDRICDTPPVNTSTWGCSFSQNSCGNDANGPSAYTSNVVDQIENYMSYDGCQNMYSLDQVDVMRGVFIIYSTLASLISSSNLVATGTNSGFVPVTCQPKADVCQLPVMLCEGSTVTYTDRSYNGPATSRAWSFPGGTPASSADSVVTVTYGTSGTYNVTLTVANVSGSNSKTLSNIAQVISASADFVSWRYDENFENADHFDSLWTLENASGGRKWEITDQAAYTGVSSAYIYNNINGLDLVDAMISPAYDLSAVDEPVLNFKGAYAMRSATSQDYLKIFYSYNCGKTWSIVGVLTGGLLTSVSDYKTSDFIPAGPGEWRDFSFPISPFVAEKSNVRFKLEFTSGGGNNIYVDDLHIESTNAIGEVELENSLSIYPNPAQEIVVVDAGDMLAEIRRITIAEVSGRIVLDVPGSQMTPSGKVEIDTRNLSPGIYIVRVQEESGAVVSRKLVIR